MDLKTVKSKLDKVNRFYDYLANNQDSISRLDKEAFLGAIRNLYDACFEEEAVPQPEPVQEIAPTPESKEEVIVPKKKKKKLVFTNNTPKEEPKPVPEVIKSTPEIKKEPVVEPKKVIETPPAPQPIKEEPKPVPEAKQEKHIPEPPKPTPTPEPKKEIPIVEPTPVKETTSFKEEYDNLFEVKIATDLSQKLSAAPIADLSRALGLNEKFLYINELFGGDVNTFQATMQKLNEFDDMDQARAYLEKELIEQQGWVSKKERKPVAKNFIKLVNRRYL